MNEPTLLWEGQLDGTLVVRIDGWVLVVRPGRRKGTVRFVVMRQKLADNGLFHVSAGHRGSAQEAMLAAERVISLDNPAFGVARDSEGGNRSRQPAKLSLR